MDAQVHISFSIVSHGHGEMLAGLLDDFESLMATLPSCEIILTLNVQENEGFILAHKGLPITIVRNPKKKGFGENHNAAFRHSKGRFFVVLNPDVRLKSVNLTTLIRVCESGDVGLCAPAVYSSRAELQDSARRFPTVGSLFYRRVLGRRGNDYSTSDSPIVVDWVAGMFMIFRRDVYASLGGFNEKYFMYFEDVDLCRRIKGLGLKVVWVPSERVIHDAQRATFRKLRHFLWHVRSAARYFHTA